MGKFFMRDTRKLFANLEGNSFEMSAQLHLKLNPPAEYFIIQTKVLNLHVTGRQVYHN